MLNCIKGQVKFTLGRIINHLDFLGLDKNCVDVSEAKICKICAGVKKEKMLALKYVKPGEAQGGPLTPTSAQPDL